MGRIDLPDVYTDENWRSQSGSAAQAVGGFVPVLISEGGYIFQMTPNGNPGPMVHRETRNMHTTCCRTFSEAWTHVREGEVMGVLELTPQGGGQKLWVPKALMGEWDARLKFWKGCYGKWPLIGIGE